MQGCPDALWREFSKRGKALAFVEQHKNGSACTSKVTGNSSASTGNGNVPAAMNVIEPSISTFIGGDIFRFQGRSDFRR